jgi:hypothetical protein
VLCIESIFSVRFVRSFRSYVQNFIFAVAVAAAIAAIALILCIFPYNMDGTGLGLILVLERIFDGFSFLFGAGKFLRFWVNFVLLL